mgnify:CR=1 FL=1
MKYHMACNFSLFLAAFGCLQLSFEFLTLHRYLLSVVDFKILINVYSARGTEAIGQRFCRNVGPVCHGMYERSSNMDSRLYLAVP